MTAKEEKISLVTLQQLNILKRIGIPIGNGTDLPNNGEYDLVIDGVLGYSLKGNPYGIPGEVIDWVNRRTEKVLSLDTPSGLDLTTGKVYNATIKANATLTLAMPKEGLFSKAAREVVGNLYLGDINVPRELYSEKSLGLKPPNVFRYSDLVRVF